MEVMQDMIVVGPFNIRIMAYGNMPVLRKLYVKFNNFIKGIQPGVADDLVSRKGGGHTLRGPAERRGPCQRLVKNIL